MKDILHLSIENLSAPITLIDCRDLVDHFPVILPGWHIIELPESTQPPILTLRLEGATYILEGAWLDEPKYRKDRLAAICALVAELIRAYVNDDSKLLCLHGAAADFAGKLVIFPNKYRAGKSILSACLAAANVKLFGDDVLPISLLDGHGIAPGLAPRLRLPLPENLDAESRHYIETNAALKGNRYLYLDLKDGSLATRYSHAPIGAFVLLEREEGIAAVLEKISESEVLRQVVWQNFARESEAPQILECLSQMVANTKRYCLRYDRAEDAVALLKETFKDWSEEGSEKSPKPRLAEHNATEPAEVPPGCFLRKPDVSMVTLDGESFLADAGSAAIHQLNSVGSAIWNLLAEPTTIGEMIELLLVAFPEVSRDQVEADVVALVNSLKSKNLLITGPNPENAKQSTAGSKTL
jgi:hypothetical protein